MIQLSHIPSVSPVKENGIIHETTNGTENYTGLLLDVGLEYSLFHRLFYSAKL